MQTYTQSNLTGMETYLLGFVKKTSLDRKVFCWVLNSDSREISLAGRRRIPDRSSDETERVLIAQWVECPSEKPGVILTRVRVPGAARDFSPRVIFQCRL